MTTEHAMMLARLDEDKEKEQLKRWKELRKAAVRREKKRDRFEDGAKPCLGERYVRDRYLKESPGHIYDTSSSAEKLSKRSPIPGKSSPVGKFSFGTSVRGVCLPVIKESINFRPPI